MNPRNYVGFDTVKGKQFSQQAGVATCLRCGTSVIAPGPVLDEELCCVRFGSAIDDEE